MKQFAALLTAAVLAVPMYAANTEKRPQLRRVSASSLGVQRLSNPRAHGLRILAQARKAAPAAARKQIGVEAITGNRSSRALIIPAAGNVAGANGTHFRSDVTIANWNNRTQNLGIMWLPNSNPDGLELFTIELEPSSVATAEDFVGQVLDLTGLGTIIALPLTPANDFDDHGAIDIYSRIWTPQPNAAGTVSQPFPGVDPEFMVNETDGVVLGMRQDAQYRTNFGIVNISEDDLTFQVAAITEDTEAPPVRIVTVPSLSMMQTGMQAGAFGQVSLRFTVTSNPATDFTWISYASSTDNITGDGWVSISANPWNDEELDEWEGIGGIAN